LGGGGGVTVAARVTFWGVAFGAFAVSVAKIRRAIVVSVPRALLFALTVGETLATVDSAAVELHAAVSITTRNAAQKIFLIPFL
jgi:hypothetical protein